VRFVIIDHTKIQSSIRSAKRLTTGTLVKGEGHLDYWENSLIDLFKVGYSLDSKSHWDMGSSIRENLAIDGRLSRVLLALDKEATQLV
jgi:hypothetical protein